MTDRQKSKLYAALFSASYLASRGLFAASLALKGAGCGGASGFLIIVGTAALAIGLFGMMTIGSIATLEARDLKGTIASVLILIVTGSIFLASLPWIFNASALSLTPGLAEIGRYAPFSAGLAATLLLISCVREPRRGALPSARVIR